MQTDMTKGNALSLLIAFTIPTFLGNLFQQLYLMADTLIVSRLLGVDALAAVGCVSGYSFMVLGFAQGLTMGFTAIIGQRYGAKDEKAMKKAYANGLYLSVIISIIVSILFSVFSKDLLRLIKTPENVIDLANDYIIVIYLFLIAPVLYNFFSGVLRCMGDSKSPLIFMVISAILNIILDCVSIIYFDLGVMGAAIATVFSQAISALLSFIYIRKKYDIFSYSKEEWKFDKNLSKTLLNVGMPGAFQFSITALSVIIVQMALNSFGSDTVAAYSCANKIENFVTQFFPALGIAISSYASQNLGAVNFTRIRDGFKKSVLINAIYSIIGLVLCFLIAKPCTYLFIENIPQNKEILEQSVFYVKMMGLFFFPLGSIYIFRTGSQGLGSGKIPLLSALIELVARATTVFSFTSKWGFLGVCLSNAASWVGAGFILPFVYLRYIKKLEKAYLIDSKNTN